MAQSANKALKHLESSPQIQLIIIDIMMPEMDGLELLNKIKEHSEWKDIPVIMCSSLADMETVNKAVEAGCKHYIIKPVKKGHLLAKVQEALEHEKPVLKDKNEIKFQLGLDEQTYQELARTFSSMIGDNIALLEKRIKREPEEGKSFDLLQLLESSVYLEAERIRVILEELTTKTKKFEVEMKESEFRLLLRELEILRSALPSVSANDVPTVKKEDDKNDSEKQSPEDTLETPRKKEQTGSK